MTMMPAASTPATTSHMASTDELIAELRAGRMIVLLDDEDRENEGDLVLAADFVTPEAINFMARHARGLICLTLTAAHAQRLGLSPMTQRNGTQHGTNFTVSIEAATGVSTGISAADRARTVQVAVARDARPEHLVQPGHIFPIVAQPGGVLARAGHTEAGCDLAQLAGATPAAVICEVMNEDGTMARLPDLTEFARHHGLKIGTIANLIEHRAKHESLVERMGSRPLDTSYGRFQLTVYRDTPTRATHLALVLGRIDPQVDTLVRVHEPVSALDLLDVSAGQHSWPFDRAMRAIAAAGRGVMVLLNCGESAGALLDRCLGVGDGHPATANLRTYGIGAQILRDLEVGRMRLLARPRKMPSMTGFGLHAVAYVEDPDSVPSASARHAAAN